MELIGRRDLGPAESCRWRNCCSRPAPLRAGENSRAVALGASLFFLQPDAGTVFSTTDPNAVSWTSLGTIPGFTPRCGGRVFVLLGKIWIEGGGACDYSQTFNDIWSSQTASIGPTVPWLPNGPPECCPALHPEVMGSFWLAGGMRPPIGMTPLGR